MSDHEIRAIVDEVVQAFPDLKPREAQMADPVRPSADGAAASSSAGL